MHSFLMETILKFRAMVFTGTKYSCPCCNSKLRGFNHGGGSFRIRPAGYCPRCNSKARHRRDWLFLKENTNLFTDRLRLLHVSPHYSLSRRFKTMPNLDYVGVDLSDRFNIRLKMDLTASSLQSNSFDAIVCIHVLEHIEDDHKAIQELFRLLKPKGWALITVPIRLDQKTFEDPSITTPEGRRRAFGETGHFRFYGYDLTERLETCGFQVKLNLGEDIDHQLKMQYGLLNDENIFYCKKP